MKIFNKKSATFFSIVALTSLFLLSSCMKKDDFVEVLGDASVKVINTMQGSDAQNLYQNDKKITTALVTGLAYNYGSPYHIFDDNLGLTVKVSGATNVVNIPSTTFQTGKNYTVWFDATNPTTPNYHVILEN